VEHVRGRAASIVTSGVRPAIVLGTVGLIAAACVRAGSPEMAALALGACAMTWVLCPVVAALAMRRGAFVRPGGRSVHTTCVPLLGGLALYVPIVCSLLWMGGPHAPALIAGCTVALLAGAWDDLRGLSPRCKIAAQVVAALILVADGYRITGLRVEPLGTLSIGGFEAAAVVAWIILTTNAINLIDGVDGLAATLALVAALAHAALRFPFPLALALAGACLGFLRHNLPRARLFLGDTGSLLLGFCLGALPLSVPGPLNLPLAAGLIAIPLADVALCVVRRSLRAKPLFAPDSGHLHHILLRLWGHSPVRVLIGLGALAAAQALVVSFRPDLWGLLAAGSLLVGTLLYVLSRFHPDWPRILRHRRAFRRIHLARDYALGRLRISESREEVRRVLERVAEDLDLREVEFGGMRIERVPAANGRVLVERVECGDATASFTAAISQDDPGLLEERRIVMCELLREAWKQLRSVAPGRTPPVPARAPATSVPIHCVVEDLAQLARVATLVPAMRHDGPLRPLVVFAGRKDELKIDGLTAPFVCLDVAPEADLARAVGARYLALLDHERPAATVVVGDGTVASGCASAASTRGINVVQFDVPKPPRNGNGGAKRAFQTPDGQTSIIRVIPALPLKLNGNGNGSHQAKEAPCAP